MRATHISLRVIFATADADMLWELDYSVKKIAQGFPSIWNTYER